MPTTPWCQPSPASTMAGADSWGWASSSAAHWS